VSLVPLPRRFDKDFGISIFLSFDQRGTHEDLTACSCYRHGLNVRRSWRCQGYRARPWRVRRWFRLEACRRYTASAMVIPCMWSRKPETSFEADLAATRLVLDRTGPCVLVGHSYGGMIISEVGARPAVRSLVLCGCLSTRGRRKCRAGCKNKTPPASNSVVPVGGGFVQVKPAALPPRTLLPTSPSPLHISWRSLRCQLRSRSFGAKATAAAWSKGNPATQ